MHLHATAFRTYPTLDWDIADGLTMLTGANGAGKSSRVDALDLCLFGAQSRSLADEHNPAFGETMVLELVFEHAGETYRVRRTFSAKGRGSTTVDLEHGAPEAGHVLDTWEPLSRESAAATQDHLETILGLTRPTFRASSFLAQGDGAAFTSAQPRERKRILAEVLGLHVWDGLLERARTEKRAAELRLADLAGMIERAEPELAQTGAVKLELDQARDNAQSAQASLDEAVSRLATARDTLAETRRRVESRAGAEKALQDADRALSELRAGIEAREGSCRSLDERLAERGEWETLAADATGLEAERDSLRAALNQWAERERLIRELADLSNRINAADEKADALRAKAVLALANEGEPCDRCHRPLDQETARVAAAGYETEANEIVRAMAVDQHKAALVSVALNETSAERPDAGRAAALDELIQGAQTARTQLAALAEAQTRRAELHTEIQQMRAGLPEREQVSYAARAQLEALGPHDPVALRSAESALASCECDVADLRRASSTNEQTIARLEERLARLDTLAAQVDVATIERDTARGDLELLTALERAYGPNGIPAFIVENSAIPQIETEACRLLRDLGTDYQVELHTQRETKTGGVSDTLDIVVYDGNRARPYEGFSGGEKTRIELALRIALAHLLANRRGAESKLLVIDEPAGLDASGMAALADVLRRLYTEGVFDRVLLVSHVAELRDAFEASIHVVCENGVSRVSEAAELISA